QDRPGEHGHQEDQDEADEHEERDQEAYRRQDADDDPGDSRRGTGEFFGERELAFDLWERARHHKHGDDDRDHEAGDELGVGQRPEQPGATKPIPGRPADQEPAPEAVTRAAGEGIDAREDWRAREQRRSGDDDGPGERGVAENDGSRSGDLSLDLLTAVAVHAPQAQRTEWRRERPDREPTQP